jgi:hypothetical protein
MDSSSRASADEPYFTRLSRIADERASALTPKPTVQPWEGAFRAAAVCYGCNMLFVLVTLSGSRRAVIGMAVCVALVSLVSYLYYRHLWSKFWRIHASGYRDLVAEERTHAESSNADANKVQARP